MTGLRFYAVSVSKFGGGFVLDSTPLLTRQLWQRRVENGSIKMQLKHPIADSGQFSRKPTAPSLDPAGNSGFYLSGGLA